jgi:uncharacterized protein
VTVVQPFTDTSGAEPVRGFLHKPEEAASGGSALVLTHSAGANCRAPLLVAIAESFTGAGFTVLRCDLPFRQERPAGPPLRTATRDQAGLRAAVDALRRQGQFGGVYLGGHSYGGRMASMLAAGSPGLVDALLLLSYPLHPPRKPEQMRTAHFADLRTPALFVSGVRDGFGTIAELESAIVAIPARTRLQAVPSAGHELINKANREQLPELVVKSFVSFIQARSY